MRILIIAILLCIKFAPIAFAQSANCPPSYVPKPSQDCKGAIKVNWNQYTYQSDSLCGSGLVNNELGRGSCLQTSERTTTWYVFKVRRSGVLKVLIYPLDITPGNGNSGDTDYDFALIKLPYGLTNTAQVCAQINANSSDTSWFRRCNYSGQRGITGISDTILTGGQGKIEDPVYVEVDDYYLLAIDNFTSGASQNRIGYSVRFGDFNVPLNAVVGPGDVTGLEKSSKVNKMLSGIQNPASNLIMLQVVTDCQVEITSSEGKKVLSSNLSGGLNPISTVGWPKGVYLLRAQSGLKSETLRLVKE
jgi:hypothetical protein